MLPPRNWKGVREEDYNQLYRHLHSEYKDFDKRHRSYQCKIQELEGELKGFHTCIQDLKAEIESLKALDNAGLKKLAKMEEVQALEAIICNLKAQLEFKRRQWTKLHDKNKDLFDRFFILDPCEGILVANTVRKKLKDHLDEEFHQQVAMQVTKKVIDIMGDMKLQKKLASITRRKTEINDSVNDSFLSHLGHKQLVQ
jgi:predicted RNase H-like nuclease (RuvC/YqgF family)